VLYVRGIPGVGHSLLHGRGPGAGRRQRDRW
jgi:hypothetical protein